MFWKLKHALFGWKYVLVEYAGGYSVGRLHNEIPGQEWIQLIYGKYPLAYFGNAIICLTPKKDTTNGQS